LVELNRDGSDELGLNLVTPN